MQENSKRLHEELSDSPRWYAAYTRFRYEKYVAEMLEYRGVVHYLPLYETVHRWKDRNARVQLPLFPSYLFVQTSLQDRFRTLTVPGVVGLVGHPTPVALDNQVVEGIRRSLSHCLPVQPHAYISQGRRVRVRSGPLAGLEGFVLRRKSLWCVVINVELIHRSMVVQIDASHLELASSPARLTRAA